MESLGNEDVSIDLIHDARYLCTRLRTDGIKDVTWLLRGQTSDKFSNTRNRGRVSKIK